jgi:hypothetical protein
LPVTFGTRDNYRTESLNFDVTYIALPYNAILDYSALAKFMAATHHGFNFLKIPSTNVDLLEHSGDLVRKKQLISQERAAAKKAALQPFPPS